MAHPKLKKYGINGVRLAKLTGQHPNTISRKLRAEAGWGLGPREAGIITCFSIMDDEQIAKLDVEFDKILAEILKTD